MKKKTENEETEIKVKKVKDFDFNVPVRAEEVDEIGELVLALSELPYSDMKQIYRAAKALKRATTLVEAVRDCQ